ncbi:MAG: 50S ribosomal protein L13 [Planctomycetaceae bacterium]|jgi:large subunit ribosomal protein L13|nr:50S ribosomal protein L13 [Planctomycetaceae bacterium]
MTASKSTMARKETHKSEWFVVDADNMIVGRLAAKLATVLMGKHKPTYTPHVDTGDYVVVLNADRIRFSGKAITNPKMPYYTQKTERKTYDHYTGYPSGRVIESALQVWEKHPEKILQEAVRRMLPKNKLGRQMLRKLKLVVGTEHIYQAQRPTDLPDYLRP